MKRRVIITPAAEQDMADAIDWYETYHPGLSLDFGLALDATLNLIVRHPGAYALVAILHPRRHPRIWQARDH
jgi:plasmid stabilization system protein ParE